MSNIEYFCQKSKHDGIQIKFLDEIFIRAAPCHGFDQSGVNIPLKSRYAVRFPPLYNGQNPLLVGHVAESQKSTLDKKKWVLLAT